MSLVPFALDPFFGEELFQPFRTARTHASNNVSRAVAMDVVEDKDKFVVKADIPGVKKEDIHVTAEGDVLSFSVESKKERKEDDKEKKYHRYERTHTFVSRSVRLPQTADLGKVKASYADGVLSLEIPKQEEKSSSRCITVA